MAEDEGTTGAKGKKKKSDYAAVEFGIGNIEFEAKGRSVVVERMFRLLLEKIEEGKLVATFRLQDDDDEEEEEEDALDKASDKVLDDAILPGTLEDFDEKEEDEEPIPLPAGDQDSSVDPPPAWDSLETEEPSVSDAEKEEFEL